MNMCLKAITAVLVATFFVTPAAFAVSMRGIQKNVVMRCETADKTANVVILSDNYTTRANGALFGDPGQLYAVTGGLARASATNFTPAELQPLTLTAPGGWFDKTIGIYQNQNYLLDLRSRKERRIILQNNVTGQKMTCLVFGNCC